MNGLLSVIACFACLPTAQPPAIAGLPQDQAKPKRPLAERIGIRETGQNGYEEYLRAADEVERGPLVEIERAQQAGQLSYLSAQGKILQAHPSLLAWIRAGNAKPVMDPRPQLKLDTPMPEFAPFRRVMRVLRAAAYVRASRGDLAGMLTTVEAGLTFSRNTQPYAMMGYLVGAANQQAMLSALRPTVPQWSLTECAAIEQLANDHLGSPETLIRAVSHEYKLVAESLSAWVNGQLDPALFVLGEVTPERVDRFKNLTAAEKAEVRRAAVEFLQRRFEAVNDVLAKPESAWSVAELTHPDPIVDSVVPGDFENPILNVAAIRRTQFRLLRLTARVRAHQWQHNALPATLKEAVPEEWLVDPLSGEPFQYDVLSAGAFTLSSKGNERSGRIDLDYQRPANEPRLPEPPE